MSTPASLSSRFWAMARRPRWIAALVLCLGIAASFAALGQWQLERSVDNVDVVEIDTETPVPLAQLAEPGRGLTETEVGRVVTASGELVPGDTVTLTGRNQDGRTGIWLVAHVVTDEGVSLAVALGWAPEDVDIPAPRGRAEWVGRYLPSEEPQSSDFEEGERSALSVAELVNLWADPGPVYGGFVVAAEPAEGLEAIDARAPEREVALNLLNLFYAVEWVIFAGFAVYLWYRLVRDAVEREDEEREAGAAVAATVD